MKQDFFEIGQIVNHFGIKGFVKVNPFTDTPEQFETLKTILIEKNKKVTEVEIEEVKYSKNQILLKIKGVEDINEAEKYRGAMIKIPREKAKKLPEGTYFIADLLGMQVYTEDKQYLGILDDIYNNGASDIYVVKNELGKQILLPAIHDVIQKIDMEQEKMIVHLIEGLL